ncbi:META domain-containing protein [Alsobacter sp. SYSU M60028]|uniref:META domain-containing protein n=1 Tax=Alsobacter ponti TaxID=2962936 RepID=A0ABT1LE50_9HYPH|nr:META domain-containing protein [Alsobacter ponti]MCP8939173.1 META domain-containing protein [Alsobacter ponti]
MLRRDFDPLEPLSMLVRLLHAAAFTLAFGGVALAQSAPLADPKAGAGGVPKAQKQFPLNFQWTASSLNGKPYSGTRPTLQIDDQLRARGFAGCNTFSATAYPLQQQRLAVGPLAVTRKGCDPGVMALEKSFLVALRTAARWDLKDGYFVVEGPNGELRFERGL